MIPRQKQITTLNQTATNKNHKQEHPLLLSLLFNAVSTAVLAVQKRPSQAILCGPFDSLIL